METTRKLDTARSLVAMILQREGTEGAEYVILLPDGRKASVYDGEEAYWDIANAIDRSFPDDETE